MAISLDSPARQRVRGLPALPRRLLGALLLLPVATWLLIAFAAPIGTVLLLSLQPTGGAFAPLVLSPTTEQFGILFGDGYYRRMILETAGLALTVTLACAVLGYPLALWLARLTPARRPWGVALILIPLLTNVVIRSLGIILLIAPDGWINTALRALGHPGFSMLFTWGSVVLALVQVFLPFMVLALMDTLTSRDGRLDDAARSLGANPTRRFFAVTLPLSLTGLRAGAMIVFLLAATSYVSATLLGGRRVLVTGMEIFDQTMSIMNFPRASALAVVMGVIGIAFTLLVGAAVRRLMPWRDPDRPDRPLPALPMPPQVIARVFDVLDRLRPLLHALLFWSAILILLFPLLLVVVGSVNDSPQAAVAAFMGFTLRWYEAILQSGSYLTSAWVSARLAFWATLWAVVIALPAAFALVRFGLPRPELIAALLMLPLAIPDIAIAIGGLRLLQWFREVPPFTGLVLVHVVLLIPFTIALLRTTVAALDLRLEEAAASLGARPLQRLRHVVLPQLAPGVAVAALIGFLISFGEVTVTAFLTTARTTTLPVRIYADAQFSLDNTVNAISTLLILATILALVLVNRLMRLDQVWKR